MSAWNRKGIGRLRRPRRCLPRRHSCSCSARPQYPQESSTPSDSGSHVHTASRVHRTGTVFKSGTPFRDKVNGLPLARIAEVVDLPKSAVHRILATLVNEWFVGARMEELAPSLVTTASELSGLAGGSSR
nr:helix-turn-helix domain-containing protein [Rhodococcus sp. WMMA185]